MRAKPGDWLIVEFAGPDQAERRARIVEVGSARGGPPFRVWWPDTGRDGVVFPGADVHVVPQEELDALDAGMAEVAARPQRQSA